jgi:hypothetical protein
LAEYNSISLADLSELDQESGFYFDPNSGELEAVPREQINSYFESE